MFQSTVPSPAQRLQIMAIAIGEVLQKMAHAMVIVVA